MNGGFDRQHQHTVPDAPASASKKLRPAGLCAVFSEVGWEDYAMGMLCEEACQPLEEHLLICSACQDLLVETEDYIRAAKAALSRTRRVLAKPASAAVALAVALLLVHLS